MAKRDPSKTARNKMIKELKAELLALLPQVLLETGIPSQSSLNALIGGKAADYMDLHHEQILSPDAYVSLYMKGFKAAMSPPGWPVDFNRRNFETLQGSPAAQNTSCFS